SLDGSREARKTPSRLAPNPWGPASAGAVGQHGARERRARGPNACPGLSPFFLLRKCFALSQGGFRTSLRSSTFLVLSPRPPSRPRCSSDRRDACTRGRRP